MIGSVRAASPRHGTYLCKTAIERRDSPIASRAWPVEASEPAPRPWFRSVDRRIPFSASRIKSLDGTPCWNYIDCVSVSVFCLTSVGLVTTRFYDLVGQERGIRENHFMTSRHLHQPVEPQPAGHARMPAPLARRQCGVLGAIYIALRNVERIKLSQIELFLRRLCGLRGELRVRGFCQLQVSIVDERFSPQAKRERHRGIGRLFGEFLKEGGLVRRDFVAQTHPIAQDETVQVNQPPDTTWNYLGNLGNDRSAKAVTYQEDVIERMLHNVVHDRFRALRMVDVLRDSFAVPSDGRGPGLVTLAFQVRDGAVPAGAVVPRTVYEYQGSHSRFSRTPMKL